MLPAIPAYLWVWPNVSGWSAWLVLSISYVYVLAGTLFIGLRRWKLAELGVNGRGIGLSLACGLVLLLARYLVIRSIAWELIPSEISPVGWIGRIVYYFLLVGLTEELLFRGLVYHALESWRGLPWAIWGSSIGFGLWHIFGQGPVAGLGTFLIGLIFAVIRWRAGGIIGLIAVHALIDLQAVLSLAESNQEIIGQGRPVIASPLLLYLGYGLLLALPLWLWKESIGIEPG
jgi:membrane protease YdiL (CAAX protease family)